MPCCISLSKEGSDLHDTLAKNKIINNLNTNTTSCCSLISWTFTCFSTWPHHSMTLPTLGVHPEMKFLPCVSYLLGFPWCLYASLLSSLSLVPAMYCFFLLTMNSGICVWASHVLTLCIFFFTSLKLSDLHCNCYLQLPAQRSVMMHQFCPLSILYKLSIFYKTQNYPSCINKCISTNGTVSFFLPTTRWCHQFLWFIISSHVV